MFVYVVANSVLQNNIRNAGSRLSSIITTIASIAHLTLIAMIPFTSENPLEENPLN